MVTFALASVVAAAMAGDATAIALDDGTVWRVADGSAEPIGGCDDGEVVALDGDVTDDGGLAIACADGSRWQWSEDEGWREASAGQDVTGDGGSVAPRRSWWPALDLVLDGQRGAPGVAWQGWVRLRWDL